jgi:hypothetical protein
VCVWTKRVCRIDVCIDACFDASVDEHAVFVNADHSRRRQSAAVAHDEMIAATLKLIYAIVAVLPTIAEFVQRQTLKRTNCTHHINNLN